MLRLKTVSIPEASGGLPESFFHVDYWSDKNIVEDYFSHNGANPSTKEALEKKYTESIPGQLWMNTVASLAFHRALPSPAISLGTRSFGYCVDFFSRSVAHMIHLG